MLKKLLHRFSNRVAEPAARRRAFASEARPYIDLPSPRDADPVVLARLREVDPLVDLHYVGLGVWVLGTYKPSRHNEYTGDMMIASERLVPPELQSMSRFRMARLIRAGLRIFDYVDEKDIDSMKVVADFRFADWRYRTNAQEAFLENLKGSDDQTSLERRKALLLDYNQTEMRDIWRYAFAGRRNIRQPGVKWATA